MALAIDITNGSGLSNEARRRREKEQSNALLTTRWSVSIGRDVRVSKLIKED